MGEGTRERVTARARVRVRDLNEVGVEVALVPLLKSRSDLFVVHSEVTLHEVIRLDEKSMRV